MKATITVLLHGSFSATQIHHPAVPARSGSCRHLPRMIACLRYDDGTISACCDLCESACPSRVITVISSAVEGEADEALRQGILHG